MPDALTTVTKLIESPPGQLAAGAVLAGIVSKGFERWESVASENDKIQVWVWLAEPSSAKKVEHWPETFARLFDRVFGDEHLSWRCFWRSSLVSGIGVVLLLSVWVMRHPEQFSEYFHRTKYPPLVELLPNFLAISAVPGYLSLLKSRRFLNVMGTPQLGTALPVPVLIAADFLISAAIPTAAYVLYTLIGAPFFQSPGAVRSNLHLLLRWPTLDATPGTLPLAAFLYPTFFTVLWVSLYGLAGLILNVARALDIGFAWFNRRCDIEKKPLSSVGLVAGALVAVIYWAAVIVSRVIS